jgi:hypothetical protein
LMLSGHGTLDHQRSVDSSMLVADQLVEFVAMRSTLCRFRCIKLQKLNFINFSF